MNTQRSKTVSVVIPYFNSATTIERAIRSVVSDDTVIEVIVADDGSSDNGRTIVMAMGGKVRFLNGRNGGAPSARNRGMAAAHGDYIVFLDADDQLDHGYIDALAMAAEGDTGIVVGGHRRFSIDNHVIDQIVYPANLNRNELLAAYLKTPAQTGSFLWRKQLVEDIGGWDERLIIFQDIDLVIRGFVSGAEIKILKTQNLLANWLDNNSETRISNNFTERKAEATLFVLEKNDSGIRSFDSTLISVGLGTRYYSLARLCYRHGYTKIGDRALKNARDVGLKGNPGSTSHAILSNIFGLKIKSRSSNFIRKLLS